MRDIPVKLDLIKIDDVIEQDSGQVLDKKPSICQHMTDKARHYIRLIVKHRQAIANI